jgi:hypothetical protein
LVALVVMACRSQPDGAAVGPAAAWVAEPVPQLGPVVARVAENPIFAEEVRAQAQRTGKPPAEALQELVTFHLLAERARERELAGTVLQSQVPPALLVQRLLEREFEPTVQPDQLTESELRAVYEQVKERFVHPRVVRVALLSVYPRRGKDKDAARAVARQTAQALFAEVSRRPDRSADDFATLQKDPAWASRNVGFARIWQGPDERFGPLRAPQGAAIARLRKPGDTTPLLEDDGAFHLARYMEEVPAKNVSFEQARQDLRAEYQPRWRREKFERFSTRMVEKHRIEIFTDRLLARPPPP